MEVAGGINTQMNSQITVFILKKLYHCLFSSYNWECVTTKLWIIVMFFKKKKKNLLYSGKHYCLLRGGTHHRQKCQTIKIHFEEIFVLLLDFLAK